MPSRILVFLVLFSLWCIFSGMFDPFHLAVGALVSFFVTIYSADLIIDEKSDLYTFLRTVWRFLGYIPWLFYQIVLSNFHVAYLALHPKAKIQPHVIRYKSILKKDISKVVFANSIILTPGTITLDITDDNEFLIHCISKKVADDLLNGDMERRIKSIFEE